MQRGSLERGAASAIRDAFAAYEEEFNSITRLAGMRFENKDWHGLQADGRERLDLYTRATGRIAAGVREILEESANDRTVWRRMKESYSDLIAHRDDFELAETFFNSVSRRIFTTVGVDAMIEYVDTDFETPAYRGHEPICREYEGGRPAAEIALEILRDAPFAVGYADAAGDARSLGEEIDHCLRNTWGTREIDVVEVLRPVFYRNKGAYIIGRIRRGPTRMPLVLALLNGERGVVVDAVLLTEDEVSIVFSFTRSYFHVEVHHPYELTRFLKSLMPLKRLAELYISIGQNKHGKTLLYRDLRHHLGRAPDRFEVARGEKGMVMIVFTMPSYDLVFKIIRDDFAWPKETSRQKVMEKYQLVFKHDRAGRLIDAQEFEHLRFERRLFGEDLLAELLRVASETVEVDGDDVVIKHLYIERRVAPLNLFVREADEESAREAIVDYGQAIKDLAASNIFPGDILLKNFGVTRHGRVVCYDYDELTLLSDCQFRQLPPPRHDEEEMGGEPWFYVGENDVFPEEFMPFLGLAGGLKEVFTAAHADLLGTGFYRNMQRRLEAGEVIEIYPYRRRKRLRESGLSSS